MSDLMELRQKIDSIDATLVNILNERARISLDVGAAKRNKSCAESGVQVYRPAREKEIYSKLADLNSGPMKDDSLKAIFREIMSASIALQKDVSISYLGPPGTFSHQAARELFGDSVTYIAQKKVQDIFSSVENGSTTYGIVPFDNSIFGAVVETLDSFVHTTAVKIRAETYLPIKQCLLSNSKLETISKVYSHRQGIGETQKWLSLNIPNAEHVYVSSTAEAAELAASEVGSAAICSELCSKLYGLEIVEKNIDDKSENVTRFLIIASESDSATNNDHTLLRFTVDHRRPGALCDSLKVFNDFGINLFKIECRPSGQRPWHYVFFVECSGHFESEPIRKSIEELYNFCVEVVVMGSFPNQMPLKFYS